MYTSCAGLGGRDGRAYEFSVISYLSLYRLPKFFVLLNYFRWLAERQSESR